MYPIPSASLVPANNDGDRGAKRKRIALSCSECKRRKIKCSKTIPCEACIKRGEQHDCKPEFQARRNESQSQASDELSDVKARLAALEAHVYGNPAYNGNGQGSFNSPGYYPASQLTSPVVRSQPRADPDSDTEEAAVILEDMSLFKATSAPPKQENSFKNESPVATTSSPLASTSQASTEPVFMLKANFRESIIAFLPSNELIARLVAHYHNKLAWFYHLVCRPQLDNELREFFILREQNNTRAIDIAWVALLLAILRQSIRSVARLPNASIPGIPPHEYDDLAKKWTEGLKGALYLADAWQRPQIRCIQAMLLIGPGHVTGMSDVDSGESTMWRSCALQSAKALQLDKLGNDENIMPAADQSLPPNSSLARQIGCRLWWHIVIVDWMAGGIGKNLHTIDENSFNTAVPLNVNDSDLGLHVHLEERSKSEMTDSSFDIAKIQLASLAHTVSALKKSGNLTYAKILEIEKSCRDMGEVFQRGLRVAASEGHQQKAAEAQWLGALSISGLNNRILRLHRPFLHRAFRNDAYHNSIAICTDSAYKIAESFGTLTDPDLMMGQPAFIILHNLNAAIALATLLFCSLHLPESDASIIAHRQHLNTISQTLQQGCKSTDPAYSKMAEHSRLTVAALVKVENDRRARRASVSDSLADVFKQVAADVNQNATTSADSPVQTISMTVGSSPSDDETAKLLAEWGVWPLQTDAQPGLWYDTGMPNYDPKDWDQLMFGLTESAGPF